MEKFWLKYANENVLLVLVEQRYGPYTIISVALSSLHEFLQLYFK